MADHLAAEKAAMYARNLRGADVRLTDARKAIRRAQTTARPSVRTAALLDVVRLATAAIEHAQGCLAADEEGAA